MLPNKMNITTTILIVILMVTYSYIDGNIFHCLQSGGIWGSISVCCVVCIVKYGLFHVSWLVWL